MSKRDPLHDNDLGMTCDIAFPGICRERVTYSITFKELSDSGESVGVHPSESPDAVGPVTLHSVRLACTQCAAAMAQTVAKMIEKNAVATRLNEVIKMENLNLGRRI